MAGKPETIEFEYEAPPGYNPAYVNGCYGGLTAQGEICAHFFVERHRVPKSQAYIIGDDGTLGRPIEAEEGGVARTLIRYVPTGVLMTPAVAKRVRDWLSHHIQAAEDKAAKEAALERRGAENAVEGGSNDGSGDSR